MAASGPSTLGPVTITGVTLRCRMMWQSRAWALAFVMTLCVSCFLSVSGQSPPSITSLSPTAGHFGDQVTIGGASFGSGQGSSTVTFNGTVALIDSWNDTSIVALVPAAATTGPVVVTVSSQNSNGVTFTVNSGTGSGLLQITSPADGAVVPPGQTLNVSVSSPDNSTFVAVAVLTNGRIDVPDPVTALPAQFSVTVPADAALQRYKVTAFGVTTAGAESATSIAIDVERADLPQSLTPSIEQLIFQAQGETNIVGLQAHFSDGRDYDVSGSSHVSYQSSDPTVATVDANGLVTAMAEGEANITATYQSSVGGRISTTVLVIVPPSLLVAAPPALNFGDHAVGTASTLGMSLTNNSNHDLTILDVATTGDYSQTNTCASSTLAPGGSCTISVTFAPTAVGARPGTVAVQSRSHVAPVTFPLTGNGISH